MTRNNLKIYNIIEQQLISYIFKGTLNFHYFQANFLKYLKVYFIFMNSVSICLEIFLTCIHGENTLEKIIYHIHINRAYIFLFPMIKDNRVHITSTTRILHFLLAFPDTCTCVHMLIQTHTYRHTNTQTQVEQNRILDSFQKSHQNLNSFFVLVSEYCGHKDNIFQECYC